MRAIIKSFRFLVDISLIHTGLLLLIYHRRLSCSNWHCKDIPGIPRRWHFLKMNGEWTVATSHECTEQALKHVWSFPRSEPVRFIAGCFRREKKA
jgi:hypothetical protein